ncbi:MAG: tetratricopeptide repeat protein, partial [Sphingomonas sp.]
MRRLTPLKLALALAITATAPVGAIAAVADAPALIARAKAKLDVDPKAALGDAEKAVHLDPSVKGGQLLRARALAALGRDAEAGVAYRAALVADPAERLASLGLARVERRSGDPHAALAILDTLVGNDEDGDARFERALVFTKLELPDKARADYTALIADKPSAWAFYNRGWLIAERGDHEDYSKALADFERADALSPKDVDTVSSIGAMLIYLKRYDEAPARYTAALAIDSTNGGAQRGRADALYDLERWQEAAAAYQARARLPDPDDALVMAAQAFDKAGDAKSAMASYDRAIRADPRSTDALAGRADLFDARGQQAKAVADYGRAIAAAPTNADLRVRRAFVYRGWKQATAALADVDAALKIDPKSSYALNALGLIHADAAEYDA